MEKTKKEVKTTNLKMLVWGIKHIAKNHNFTACTNYREDGCVFIMGENVPTLSDVQMLCEDCKVDKSNIISHGYGIEVFLPCDEDGNIDKKWSRAEYEVPFHEFWRRIA